MHKPKKYTDARQTENSIPEFHAMQCKDAWLVRDSGCLTNKTQNLICIAQPQISRKSRELCKIVTPNNINFNMDYKKTDEILMKMTEKTARILDS